MSAHMVPIGEVVDFIGGGTPSRDVDLYWNGSIPWASVKDFKGPSIDSTLESITHEGLSASSSALIPAGHVIMPTRMALGKAAINSIDVAINQDLKALKPKARIDTRYLLHAILSRAKEIQSHGKGATVQGITIERLRAIQIPLPPLEAQRCIAAILDKTAWLHKHAMSQLDKANRLLASLFVDAFGDPLQNPHSWSTMPLAEAVQAGTDVTYEIVQAGEEFLGGIPYIRTGDIVNGEIDTSSLRHTDPAIAGRFVRSTVRTGEIVMSIRATVGTTAMVPECLDGANLTQGTARIAPGKRTNGLYLLQYLRMPSTQEWIQRQVKGATFREITLTRLRELPVLVPPMQAQEAYAARAIIAYSTIETTKALITIAQSLTLSLGSQILI